MRVVRRKFRPKFQLFRSKCHSAGGQIDSASHPASDQFMWAASVTGTWKGVSQFSLRSSSPPNLRPTRHPRFPKQFPGRDLFRVTTGHNTLEAYVLSTGLCGIVSRRHLLVCQRCRVPESRISVTHTRAPPASARIQIDHTSDASSSLSSHKIESPKDHLERSYSTFGVSRESIFAQPAFLPLPTNEPHVQQEAQEITQTF